MTQESDPTAGRAAELRQRIENSMATGRTVALSSSEMNDPDVRRMLPELLESLAAGQTAAAAGLSVPGYTILGEIGQGGMSTVYLARDERLQRNVALKRTRRAADDRERDRAVREARALAKLTHPHIVTVHDIVEQGNDIVIVMAWVDGISLAGLLRGLPSRPEAEDMERIRAVLGAPADGTALESTTARTFARMIRDVAQAAQVAHEAGLLHLDIKPSNVLVASDGRALLADFGVVREIDAEQTHTRSFAGTPIYAAPEQLRRDDAAFGPATDVYGLGMTLYELLARSRPLADAGLTEMLRRAEVGAIPRLSTRAEVARDLENIVHMAIAADPSRRYASAAALAADLTAFLEGRPVKAAPERPLQRLRRRARAEPWKATLIAVLAVTLPVLVGLGGYMAIQMPRIERDRQREASDRARQVAQLSFMNFLVRGRHSEDDARNLRAALELDPGNAAILACLLTRLGIEHWDETLAEIDRLEPRLRNSAGVQAVRRRVEEHRPFLTAAEARELATPLPATADPDVAPDVRLLDLLLVALDRILRFEDTLRTDQLELARDCLDEVFALQEEHNFMARGLQAWVAGNLRDERLLEVACSGLAMVWPDNRFAMQWRVYAQGAFAPERGAALGQALLAAHRDDVGLAVQTALMLHRAGRLDEALALLREAKPRTRGDRSLRLKSMAAVLSDMDDLELARKLLPAARAETSDEQWFLIASQLHEPEALAHWTSRVESGEASSYELHQAIGFAVDSMEPGLILGAADEGMRRFPHHWEFRRVKAMGCALAGRAMASAGRDPTKAYTMAADLFATMEPPQRDVGRVVALMAWAYCATKRWQELLTLATSWQDSGEDPIAMHYYLGIALSRTGRADDAAQHFRRHIELGRPVNRSFVQASFELVWLQVAPGSPPCPAPMEALRDFEREFNWAEDHSRGKQEGAARQPSRRPWIMTIAAYVYLANGMNDKARTCAEAALRYRENAGHEAHENLKELIEDALRRCGQ